MRKFFTIIFILIICINNLFSKIDFSGQIVDLSDNSPLPGTSIRIENTQFGAIANSKGFFIIKNLPDKLYSGTLIISLIGYEAMKIKVDFHKNINNIFKLKVQALQVSDIVVTANKKVQSIQEVPISVALIDKKLLLDRGINRIDEALKYVAGLELNQGNVSIRGSSGFSFGVGSRATLLIDGFPMNSGDNGDIKFDALPIFNIDRIEVVKGAGSALWGTGAIGGVINLIFEEPNEKANIKYRAISGFYTEPRYEQWKFTQSPNFNSGLNLSYSKKFDKLSFLVSGSLYNDEGYRDYDDSKRYNAFTKLSYEFSGDNKLKVLFNLANEDHSDWVYWNSLDSATRPPTNTNRNNRIESNKLALFSEYSHIFDDKNFALVKFGINQTQFNNSYDISNPEYRQSKASSYYYDLQGVSNFTLYDNNLNFTYGFTQTYSDVNSFTYGNRYQSILALYTQFEYNIPNLFTLTIGGRADKEITKNIESELVFSPKMGLNIPIYEKMNLRASLGKGFRVSSVAERYSAIFLQGFEVLPNLDLKPEISWSYEIGSNYQFDLLDNPTEIDISIFNNELENLIEPTFANNAVSKIQFKNVVSARIRGAELSFRTFLFKLFGLETSLTIMDPRDLLTEQILNYRSEYLWYNRLIIPLNNIEFQLDYRYKSKVQNIDTQLGLLVKDSDARVAMNVVDARLIFDIKKIFDFPIKLTLNANNIFDYYYTEMVGNIAPTRLISLQIDGEF